MRRFPISLAAALATALIIGAPVMAETDPQTAYLVANATKEGVSTTESGLQYKVITEGSGASPQPSDQVEVHYEGKLVDGTVFDSSYARGAPATFPVNRLIPGFTEGLLLMKEGGKSEFTIPSNIGYGAQGAGTIPPYATLIFTVELLKIK